MVFAPHPKGSPHQELELIAVTLRRATRQLGMALFVFSAQSITEAIADRVAAVVVVRLVADLGFATRRLPDVLDLFGIALPDRRCAIEAGNAPLDTPLEGVGTPRLARGDKLCHKCAVIGSNTVITGSFN